MTDEFDINIENLDKSLKEQGTSWKEVVIKNTNFEEMYDIEDFEIEDDIA